MKKYSLIIISLLFTASLFALNTDKKSYTTKKTSVAPVIDGILDAEIWDQVEWTGDFIQFMPNEGEAPSQQTAFKILYDDNNLYVFVKAYDTEPDLISQRLARRDHFPGDFVEINIDSDLDRQTAFSFSGSASGVIGDEAISRGGNNWDGSWNPIWYFKASIDNEGWNGEFKIPFSQLRFGKKENHVWGLQVMRNLFRKDERSRWQFIPQDAPVMLSMLGDLQGIENIEPKRQIDIIPYALAKTEGFEKEIGNPFADGSNSNLAVGVDGKIGITNDLTLDFTINPDFGQVEADPSEVNLSAFESYFSEQRPFFIEGKSIYNYQPSSGPVISDFNRDNLFYSRRIGRRPHLYPDLRDDEYADMPESTTILTAFKLSGKTKNGLSIGIMESLAAEEKANVSYMGNEREVTVEPMTNYFVARVKKDFNKGETTIGGMITAVNRDIESDDLLFLPKSAYTGGIDFKHYWKERTYYVGLNADFSHIKGDMEAITNLQESSARYYQRPDAEHLKFDENKTELTGTAASLKVGRGGNGKWNFESSLTYRSPGFEINDIGFMQSADVIHHGTWVGYYIRKPFGIFENFFLNNNYWMSMNFDGKMKSFGQNVNFHTKLKNKWSFNGSLTHNGEYYNVSALRGGPALMEPGRWSYNININSDNRKKIRFYGGFWLNRGLLKYTRSNNMWTGFTYQPMDALSISLSTSINNYQKELQYIAQEEMNGDARYIFGSIDQKTLSFTLRLNYNVTPDLTIQYYGQPFTSAGDYEKYKIITDSKADVYENRFSEFTSNQISYNADEELYGIDEDADGVEDYSFSRPQYNFAQFRSNLVVRWEYVPGSTLFLVWSQGRTMSNSMGEFNFTDNIGDLFDIQARNIFLVKFSYRISV